MENNTDKFNLQINEEEYEQWYKNWRTEEMPISTDDVTFEIWMNYKIDHEFDNTKNLVGKLIWYSIDEEFNELTTNVYYSGVIIKNGKVIKEDETTFYIEGYDKAINKKELSHKVYANRNSLLFRLHYDGENLYNETQIRHEFLEGNFICEELLYHL